MSVTLFGGIATASAYVYLGLSSFIFHEEFHMSPVAFGWHTAIVGVMLIVWARLCPKLIGYWSQSVLMKSAIGILCICGSLILISNKLGIIGPTLFLFCVVGVMLAVIITKTITMRSCFWLIS